VSVGKQCTPIWKASVPRQLPQIQTALADFVFKPAARLFFY
jgi:hypothetical protein